MHRALSVENHDSEGLSHPYARRWKGWNAFRATAIALLLIAVGTFCSSAPKSPSPEIDLMGEQGSLQGLAGRWEGTYTNPVNGRTGSIVFEVSSTGTEAHGDILMIPPGASEPVSSSSPSSGEETLRTMPRVLQINFMRATGSGLTGTVGPYEDLECGCDARSTFQGELRGDKIEGTFVVEYLDKSSMPDPAKPFTRGTWQVARKKKA
jgi:hypothetical protein